MKILYIIGNGFDLYHGLDTYYTSFGLFLKNYHSEFYYKVTELLQLPELDENDKESLKSPLWSNFENSLANLNTEEILDNFANHSPNTASDDFRDRDWFAFRNFVEREIKYLWEGLLDLFKEFILQVKYPELDYILDKLLMLNTNQLFLTFNYTDTLERYYFVKPKNLKYIHNLAANENEIILGHGINPENLKPKKQIEPEGLSEEELESWREEMADNYDYSYELGKDEVYSYFERSAKPTKQIIELEIDYFKSLKEVKSIYVLGHSISKVDMPYFAQIVENVKAEETRWIVSYYNNWEIETKRKSLFDIGVEAEQIEFIKLVDLESKNQLKLF